MAKNTLNLGGDCDDLDIVVGAEATFGIKFADAEVEHTYTVGQFYDLILRKYRVEHPQTRTCLSQIAFHRLRRAVGEMGVGEPITPETSLSEVIGAIRDQRALREVWDELAQRSGLRLPDREIKSFPGDVLVGPALLLGLMGIFVTAFRQIGAIDWVSAVLLGFFAAVPAVVLIGLLMLRWFGSVPQRIVTVGDLARESAGCSFATLNGQRAGSSPHDIWQALLAILRDASGHRGPINRATTFFPEKA